jgi:hypothetical protein
MEPQKSAKYNSRLEIGAPMELDNSEFIERIIIE